MEAKKSLGQNFFTNKNLGDRITDEVLENNTEIIVEIGPGRGFFTDIFYKKGRKLILVEKDNDLAKELQMQYPEAEIINVDFLLWEMGELKKFKAESITFFGSLPYNVSKPIVRKIIQSEYFNSNAYFIIQKEVGDKYLAKEPNNNILSLETQLFADVKRVLNISPESFKPRPKVNSSFVVFKPKDKSDVKDTNSFVKFIQTCFSHPRKTIRNNLKHMQVPKNKELETTLSKRPEHLSLEEYTSLYTKLVDDLI